MSERPLGAAISHALAARGVDVIFGIPGVHNVEMYRGIEEAGITHVLARHEQGAGFMADGYARATGRVGVAYLITGPGLTNALTPLGQAYSDSVSVMAISSCLDETAAQKGQLHQMRDQVAAGASVCASSDMARNGAAAFGLIDRALGDFATNRHRSRHITVPIEVLARYGGEAPRPPQLGAPPVPMARDVEIAAKALAAAQKPLFVFGGGAAHASPEARAVLAAKQAASFTTYAGRGICDPQDPLHFGAYLARPDSARVLAEADCVIVIGSELAQVDIWRAELGHSVPMIRVDIDPDSLNDGQGLVGQRILGDARPFLAALLEALAKDPCGSEWSPVAVAKTKLQWRAEVAAERPGIVEIAEAMQVALPEDTMYFSDMTQFAYVAKEVLLMPKPGHWHHPFGFGTLGYALPAGIGGKVGRGAAPVVVIAGDYGFQYTLAELGVAVELGISLPILLWDNGKLKEIEDCMVARQIPPNAVVAQNPDFCALALAYGAHAAHPASLRALEAALKQALAANGPTLIYVTPEILADQA